MLARWTEPGVVGLSSSAHCRSTMRRRRLLPIGSTPLWRTSPWPCRHSSPRCRSRPSSARATNQSRLQAALLWSPGDPAATTPRHSSSRHWGDALLYLRTSGGGDGPSSFRTTRPCVRAHRHPRGHSRTRGACASSRLPGRRPFCEAMSISPMDMDAGDDLILGWDWISSHDLRLLYDNGRIDLRSGQTNLQLDLLSAGTRVVVRTLSVTDHGEFRRLLRQLERDPLLSRPATAPSLTLPPLPPTPRRSPGWSRPVHADHAELAAFEAAQLQAARARRRPGRPPEPHCYGLFAWHGGAHGCYGTPPHVPLSGRRGAASRRRRRPGVVCF